MAPVMALARSEATKAAKFATSRKVGKRLSSVPLRARSASIASTVLRALPGHPIELVERAPGEEDPRSLTGEGTGDRAADRTAASVDHRALVLQQH